MCFVPYSLTTSPSPNYLHYRLARRIEGECHIPGMLRKVIGTTPLRNTEVVRRDLGSKPVHLNLREREEWIS